MVPCDQDPSAGVSWGIDKREGLGHMLVVRSLSRQTSFLFVSGTRVWFRVGSEPNCKESHTDPREELCRVYEYYTHNCCLH